MGIMIVISCFKARFAFVTFVKTKPMFCFEIKIICAVTFYQIAIINQKITILQLISTFFLPSMFFALDVVYCYSTQYNNI